LTDSKTIDAEDQEVQSRHHSANATVTSILTNDINNHNDPDDEPRPHFEYKGGTFAYGLGALDKVPARDDTTDRLYVKVRRKYVKLHTVGGGSFNPASGDVFILKSKLDSMSGMDPQTPDNDPIRDVLNGVEGNAPWASDPRIQLSATVSLDYGHLYCHIFLLFQAGERCPKRAKRHISTLSCCWFSYDTKNNPVEVDLRLCHLNLRASIVTNLSSLEREKELAGARPNCRKIAYMITGKSRVAS
jgi:hypothetical protein